MRNVFRARTAVELIVAIFRHEGWQFTEGENRSKRVTDNFELSVDHRTSQYVARRRTASVPPKQVGIREAVEYLALNAEEVLGDNDTGYIIPIMMIAHLFGREPEQVAEMVIRKRDQEKSRGA